MSPLPAGASEGFFKKRTLPPGIRACLFDLDGVLTQTSTVHAAAWKRMFDEFLASYSEDTGTPLEPFTSRDYEQYVDGKPRTEGARSFLASRGIQLPEGSPEDIAPRDRTVLGLSNQKNDYVVSLLERDGAETYASSVRFVKLVRAAGMHCAVVSSSAHAQLVLEKAGIADLFEARIDGVTARERRLPGKPAPDMFLAGAEAVGVSPAEAAVFEDALSGVSAGRAGNFGFVVGVDRAGQADALHKAGSDVVVADLAEFLDRDQRVAPRSVDEGGSDGAPL